MFEKGLLAGKRILVTGGGSGLGAAMGRRFVELGAELIICGRRLELLEATAAEMRSEFGGKVSVVRCDIRDGAAVDAMMDTVWREAPLDVLVNNAAATFIAQTEHLSFRAADAVLAPTLHGAMYCTLGAGKRWIDAAHKGVVLSILSTSTITGRAFTVPSAMAKSAILAMTKSLAVEWGPKGIRTVAIAPGAFPTPGASGQLRPEGRGDGWASKNPLGRVGEHGELADLASFLISDRAGYINGEMVVQDGGSHLRSSGAEDLLQWTDAQWEQQRAAAVERLSVSWRCSRFGIRSCLSKKAFPGYPSVRDEKMPRPSSSHNIKGTRFGHVRAANLDIPDGECGCVRDRDPGAGAERAVEIFERAGQACGRPPRSEAKPAGARPRAARSQRCSASSAPGAPTPRRLTARRCASLSQSRRPRRPIRRIVRAIRPTPSFRPGRPRKSNEVSVMIGYTLKPGSEATLEVAGAATQCTPRATASGSRTPPMKTG